MKENNTIEKHIFKGKKKLTQNG